MANLSITLPVVGSDENTWGDKVNAALTALKDQANTAAATADAASTSASDAAAAAASAASTASAAKTAADNATAAVSGISGIGDISSPADQPMQTGVPIADYVKAKPGTRFAAAEVTLPELTHDVPVTVQTTAGAVIGTATLTAGNYRAVFASQLTYTDGALVVVVPGASGGGGLSLKHSDAAFVLPSAITAPNKPTGVTVAATAGSATISWTAPTSGVAPQWYTVFRRRSGVPVGLVGRLFSTSTITVAGHVDGDFYAVEAVVPGKGSGLTAWVDATGATDGPGILLDYSALADGATIPSTDWTVTQPTGAGGLAKIGSGGVHLVHGASSTSDVAADRAILVYARSGQGPSRSWQYECLHRPDAASYGYLDLFLGSDSARTVDYVNFRQTSASAWQINRKVNGGTFTLVTSGTTPTLGTGSDTFLRFVAQEQADGSMVCTISTGTSSADAVVRVTGTIDAATAASIDPGTVCVVSRVNATSPNGGFVQKQQRLIPLAKLVA